MTLAGAISNLGTKALALTSIAVKSAGGPKENADPCPFFIAYLASGATSEENVAKLRADYVVKANFYFNAANLGQAYKDLNAAAPEYLKALIKDPTLGDTCNSVVHPTFETMDDEYNTLKVVVLSFSVPVKIRETPA